MRKILLSMIMAFFASSLAHAADIKMGVLLGFTGPIESLTPDIAAGAELAMKEASESGLLLGGHKVVSVRADSTCTDAAAATSAAERLITVEKVIGIMGADCSGVTTAVANNVAVPNGVVSISPSATSPALSTIEDKGFFFRTAPSDARQGKVLAAIVKNDGIKTIAITYVNNDYGKGLADSFSNAFKALGGEIVISAAHEDDKADYAAEVGALAAAGSDYLAVFGYVDGGGKNIVQTALDTDAFDKFIFADGMVADSLVETLGSGLDDIVIGTTSGSNSKGEEVFTKFATDSGLKKVDGPYMREAYDAAALMILAMQAANSESRSAMQANIMNVANAPGTKILPGELAKALKILKDGGQVDYEGASNVEFNEVGEAKGSFKQLGVRQGKFFTVGFH